MIRKNASILILVVSVPICCVSSVKVQPEKVPLLVPEITAGHITNETTNFVPKQDGKLQYSPTSTGSIILAKYHTAPWARIKRNPRRKAKPGKAWRKRPSQLNQAWRRKAAQECIAKLRKALYHRYHGKHHHDVAWRRKEQQCKQAWRHSKPRPKPAPARKPAPSRTSPPHPTTTPILKPTFPDVNKNHNQEPKQDTPIIIQDIPEIPSKKQMEDWANVDTKDQKDAENVSQPHQKYLKRSYQSPPPFVPWDDYFQDIDTETA